MEEIEKILDNKPDPPVSTSTEVKAVVIPDNRQI